MIAIGVLEIILGALGLIVGANMYGDIGIACIVGALAALLAGIGFLVAASRIKKLEK